MIRASTTKNKRTAWRWEREAETPSCRGKKTAPQQPGSTNGRDLKGTEGFPEGRGF